MDKNEEIYLTEIAYYLGQMSMTYSNDLKDLLFMDMDVFNKLCNAILGDANETVYPYLQEFLMEKVSVYYILEKIKSILVN